MAEDRRIDAAARALYEHQAEHIEQAMALWPLLNNQVKGAYRRWAAAVLLAADTAELEAVEETRRQQ